MAGTLGDMRGTVRLRRGCMQTGASVSELRRSQQQYNFYVAALGAETVARSGLVRQLRNLLSQQASPPGSLWCSVCSTWHKSRSLCSIVCPHAQPYSAASCRRQQRRRRMRSWRSAEAQCRRSLLR